MFCQWFPFFILHFLSNPLLFVWNVGPKCCWFDPCQVCPLILVPFQIFQLGVSENGLQHVKYRLSVGKPWSKLLDFGGLQCKNQMFIDFLISKWRNLCPFRTASWASAAAPVAPTRALWQWARRWTSAPVDLTPAPWRCVALGKCWKCENVGRWKPSVPQCTWFIWFWGV